MDAEPIPGITDAIQAADLFVQYARAHQSQPDRADYRRYIVSDSKRLIAKLQALGPVGEE